MIHEILAKGLYDRDFVVQLQQRRRAGQLSMTASDEFGMFVRTEVPAEEACYDPQNKLWWDRHTNAAVVTHTPGRRPVPARRVQAVRRHAGQAGLPTAAGARQGLHAGVGGADHRHSRPRRSGAWRYEMGVTARDQRIELPIAWTDSWGNEHDTVTGNPVAFHAMRGLAAHSNGFQTIRALAHPDVAARHHRPARRLSPQGAVPAPDTALRAHAQRPARGAARTSRWTAWPLGWPSDPDDLFVNDDGSPVRIDKAFSWEYPLSVHGLMHNVITNAWRGDPYRIDTLLIFMANMAWNSTMNTAEVRKMLNDKDENERRVQDPVPGRRRRLPVRDDGVRRSDPARHHLPRAPRRDVDARPADLGVRRPGRFGAHPGAAAVAATASRSRRC